MQLFFRIWTSLNIVMQLRCNLKIHANAFIREILCRNPYCISIKIVYKNGDNRASSIPNNVCKRNSGRGGEEIEGEMCTVWTLCLCEKTYTFLCESLKNIKIKNWCENMIEYTCAWKKVNTRKDDDTFYLCLTYALFKRCTCCWWKRDLFYCFYIYMDILLKKFMKIATLFCVHFNATLNCGTKWSL